MVRLGKVSIAVKTFGVCDFSLLAVTDRHLWFLALMTATPLKRRFFLNHHLLQFERTKKAWGIGFFFVQYYLQFLTFHEVYFSILYSFQSTIGFVRHFSLKTNFLRCAENYIALTV